MLSSDQDVKVTALHLVDAHEYNSKEEYELELNKIKELELRPRLMEAVKINPSLSKIKLQVMPIQSDIDEDILDYAENNQIDFIIMGSHGLAEQSKWENHLDDSNSYKVVLAAKCPVFTFTHWPSNFKIHKITLPLDLTEGTLEKIPVAIQLAKLFNASIHLLSVEEDLNSNRAKKLEEQLIEVSDQLDREKIKVEKSLIESDDLPDSLITLNESISSDLIIMMNRPRSLWDDLFITDNAKRIICFSKTPVLSMRGGNYNTSA